MSLEHFQLEWTELSSLTWLLSHCLKKEPDPSQSHSKLHEGRTYCIHYTGLVLSNLWVYVPVRLSQRPATVPSVGPLARWWPAGLRYRGVSSPCSGGHWGGSQAPACGRAAGGLRWRLHSRSCIWRTQSPGSARWSSSWAWTPRAGPPIWTGGSAGPRRCPVGSGWWRPRSGLRGSGHPTLTAERTGDGSGSSEKWNPFTCYFVSYHFHSRIRLGWSDEFIPVKRKHWQWTGFTDKHHLCRAFTRSWVQVNVCVKIEQIHSKNGRDRKPHSNTSTHPQLSPEGT